MRRMEGARSVLPAPATHCLPRGAHASTRLVACSQWPASRPPSTCDVSLHRAALQVSYGCIPLACAAVAGFMPAKTTLFTEKCVAKFDLGEPRLLPHLLSRIINLPLAPTVP